MQPLLRQLILERIRQYRAAGTTILVLDMPLLFEKQLDSLCDTVWCVWLPHAAQLERLMTRDQLDEASAEARIASQLSPDAKAARSQVVIDNSGTIDSTQAKVRGLYREELRYLNDLGGQDGTNADTPAQPQV